MFGWFEISRRYLLGGLQEFMIVSCFCVIQRDCRELFKITQSWDDNNLMGYAIGNFDTGFLIIMQDRISHMRFLLQLSEMSLSFCEIRIGIGMEHWEGFVCLFTPSGFHVH
jgi:hypothetical protein